MKLTESEIEDFPDCEGCLCFIDNECADESAYLRDDCYIPNDFVNRAWEKMWKKVQSPN